MREFPALVICKILIRKDALHIEEAYKLHFAVKFTKSTKSDNHIVQLMRSLRVQSQGWGGSMWPAEHFPLLIWFDKFGIKNKLFSHWFMQK